MINKKYDCNDIIAVILDARPEKDNSQFLMHKKHYIILLP